MQRIDRPDRQLLRFSVRTESDAGRSARIRVAGRLDLGTAGSLRSAGDAALTRSPAVTVDLAELSSCDASGLAVLVELDGRARAIGRELHIVGVHDPVLAIFEISGLTGMID